MRQQPSDARVAIAPCGSVPNRRRFEGPLKIHRAFGNGCIGPSWNFALLERDTPGHSGLGPASGSFQWIPCRIAVLQPVATAKAALFIADHEIILCCRLRH
jgi:hypothetical protein